MLLFEITVTVFKFYFEFNTYNIHIIQIKQYYLMIISIKYLNT